MELNFNLNGRAVKTEIQPDSKTCCSRCEYRNPKDPSRESELAGISEPVRMNDQGLMNTARHPCPGCDS